MISIYLFEQTITRCLSVILTRCWVQGLIVMLIWKTMERCIGSILMRLNSRRTCLENVLHWNALYISVRKKCGCVKRSRNIPKKNISWLLVPKGKQQKNVSKKENSLNCQKKKSSKKNLKSIHIRNLFKDRLRHLISKKSLISQHRCTKSFNFLQTNLRHF